MSNVAIFSSWNQCCGLGEHAYFLAGALQNKGHNVIIISPEIAPGHPAINIRQDGPKVFRLFQSGFTKEATGNSEFKWEEILKVLEEEKIEIILHSYQDYLYPNKKELNHLISEFKCKLRGRAYIIIHDTCYSPELNFSQYSGAIIPAKTGWLNPPQGNIKVINQGIPEFLFEGFDRAKFREDMSLPPIPKIGVKDDNARFIISTFGLGRCKIEEILNVVKNINSFKSTSAPISVVSFVSNPNNYEFQNKLSMEHDELYVIQGYLPEVKLASYLHAGDCVAVIYPQIQGMKATSSALRFALGSSVPVIASLNNWTSDLKDSQGWIQTDGTIDHLKHEIVKLFQLDRYDAQRRLACNAQRRLVSEIGWSKIAEEFTNLFQGKL